MERQSSSPDNAGSATLAFAVALPFIFLLILPTLEAAHGVVREFLVLQKELREETTLILALRSVATTEWQELRSPVGIVSVPGIEVVIRPSGAEELGLLVRREGTDRMVELRLRPEEEAP